MLSLELERTLFKLRADGPELEVLLNADPRIGNHRNFVIISQCIFISAFPCCLPNPYNRQSFDRFRLPFLSILPNCGSQGKAFVLGIVSGLLQVVADFLIHLSQYPNPVGLFSCNTSFQAVPPILTPYTLTALYRLPIHTFPFLESLLVWGFRIKSFHRFFLLSQTFHSRYAFAVRPVFLPRFPLPY